MTEKHLTELESQNIEVFDQQFKKLKGPETSKHFQHPS